MTTDRIMIDCETLGTDPGATIVSIGAVAFDADGPGDEFRAAVSPTSCQRHGLSIDAETLEWWLTQDAAAREQLRGGTDLETALEDLTMFVADADEIWANSPAFDCAILGAAYDAVGLTTPWAYYETRDYRTLSDLAIAPRIGHEGTDHDALDDARHQARVAAETLRRIDAVGAEVSDE